MTDWMTRNPQINDSPNLLGHPVQKIGSNSKNQRNKVKNGKKAKKRRKIGKM